MGNVLAPIKFLGSTRDMVLQKDDSKRIEDYLKLDHEIGGCLEFNCVTNKLEIKSTVSGEGSSIDLKVCKFEFHCHPNHCNPGNCHLGVPSNSDLKNIAERSNEGNCCHIVFAHEGMYVCSCNKARIKWSNSVFMENMHELLNKLKQEQDRFYSSGHKIYPYSLFQKRWLETLKHESSVFTVQFIKKRQLKNLSALELISVDEGCWDDCSALRI
jgi:hypothetical protein